MLTNAPGSTSSRGLPSAISPTANCPLTWRQTVFSLRYWPALLNQVDSVSAYFNYNSMSCLLLSVWRFLSRISQHHHNQSYSSFSPPFWLNTFVFLYWFMSKSNVVLINLLKLTFSSSLNVNKAFFCCSQVKQFINVISCTALSLLTQKYKFIFYYFIWESKKNYILVR